MKTILLIDDTQEQLEGLAKALRLILGADEANIVTWLPTKDDPVEPVDTLDKYLAKDAADPVAFVVTDYDLTGKGSLGLYGSTVVDQCQLVAVPVGNYSRGKKKRLPAEPSLFEIRVPADESHEAAAKLIASVFRGFEEIRTKVDQLNPMPRSPAAGIAALLGRPNDQSQFSLYGTRYPAVNSGLIDRIDWTAPDDKKPTADDVRKLFSYVAGHVLLNLVLRYPGPIVSLKALAAYCAIQIDEAERIREIFKECRYDGPFKDCYELFWLDKVVAVIDAIDLEDVPTEATAGEVNRRALEKHFGVKLTRPVCNRCDGLNGGFLCPFTERTVCIKPDCSTGSNGWIPAGARISRIEKGFFDEWSPLLGM
jgi:hypothetical protein